MIDGAPRPDAPHPAATRPAPAGLVVCASAFVALGRSFGFAAGDRGVKRHGPYAIVRHPIYASYVLLVFGYLAQSLSIRNVLVLVLVCGCNVGQIRAEERFLAQSPDYRGYRAAVRWSLVPGIW